MKISVYYVTITYRFNKQKGIVCVTIPYRRLQHTKTMVPNLVVKVSDSAARKNVSVFFFINSVTGSLGKFLKRLYSGWGEETCSAISTSVLEPL